MLSSPALGDRLPNRYGLWLQLTGAHSKTTHCTESCLTIFCRMPPHNTPNSLILQNIHLCGRRSLHPKRRHIQYIKKEMRKCKLTSGITRPKRFARQPLFPENPHLGVGPHLKNDALGVAVHAVVRLGPQRPPCAKPSQVLPVWLVGILPSALTLILGL